LSSFKLTFTNNEIRTSTSTVSTISHSSGGSGRGGRVYTSVTPDSNWISDEKGWRVQNTDGTFVTNSWYEATWNGVTSWYRFGADSYMVDGWFTDTDGRTYYFHTASDGTRGHMYTGWQVINGKSYYFETVKGSYQGHLYKSTTTPDGHQVGADGARIDS
jgi:glucan-binding YG repeat protein